MIMIGDIHGNMEYIIEYCNKNDINNQTLIQVGDFGFFNFDWTIFNRLKKLNQNLISHNNILYIIRGNHDNPLYWDNYVSINDKMSLDKFHNIKFISDGTILSIDDKQVLFFGGGISIDRLLRTENIDYWSDEEINYPKIVNVLNNLSTDAKIDIIVSHTPITSIIQSDTHLIDYYQNIDKFLLDDLNSEQQKLGKLLIHFQKHYNVEMWISGHMHLHKIVDYNNIKFICVDTLEFFNPYPNY